MNVRDFRKSQFEVNDLFINRWSPRAMSGEDLDEASLMSLFEAARWAPSASNNQPWRFIFARRNTAHWEKFFNLLAEGNRIWAKNAAVLIVVISKNTFDSGTPSVTHSYDAGAAWVSLALMGSLKDLVVHGMQGFDYEKARGELGVPDDYTVEAMIAVGKKGRKEDLPAYLQERELPNMRKNIAEITSEGNFPVKSDENDR